MELTNKKIKEILRQPGLYSPNEILSVKLELNYLLSMFTKMVDIFDNQNITEGLIEGKIEEMKEIYQILIQKGVV